MITFNKEDHGAQLSYPAVYSRRLQDNPKVAPLILDYDWWAAFGFARPQFAMEDVVEVVALDAGDNDGPPWVGIFLLASGKYGGLNAWCDYTGWD
jgi:hypothetical protein